MDRELVLPSGYTDYAWEVEVKGVFWDARVRIGDTTVAVTFYDAVRLSEDVHEELAAGRSFAVQRLLVVPKVTEASMRAVVSGAPEDFFA
jgi:hypothetical protein